MYCINLHFTQVAQAYDARSYLYIFFANVQVNVTYKVTYHIFLFKKKKKKIGINQ